MAQPEKQTRKRKVSEGETDDLLLPDLKQTNYIQDGFPLPIVTSAMKAVCFAASNHPCTILWHTIVNEFASNFSDYPHWMTEIADHVQSRLKEEDVHDFLVSDVRTRCGPRELSDLGGRQDTWHGSWRQASNKEILQKTRTRFNGDRGPRRPAASEGSSSHQHESPIATTIPAPGGWGDRMDDSKLAEIPVERSIPGNNEAHQDSGLLAVQTDGESLERTASDSDSNSSLQCLNLERMSTQQIGQSNGTATERICLQQTDQSIMAQRAVYFARNHPCTILWHAIVKEFACNLTDYPLWRTCIADHVQARLRDEGIHDWLVCEHPSRGYIQSAVPLDDQGASHGVWRRATKQEIVAKTRNRFRYERSKRSGMASASEGVSLTNMSTSPTSVQCGGEMAISEPVAESIARSIPCNNESSQCKVVNADVAHIQPESRTGKRKALASETDSSSLHGTLKLSKPMPNQQSIDEVTTETRAVCFGTNHPCTILWHTIVNEFSRNFDDFPKWTPVIAVQVQARLQQEGIHDSLVCINSTGALVRPEGGPLDLAKCQRRYSWKGKWRQATKAEFCNKTRARFKGNRCQGEPHACEALLSSQSRMSQTNPALAPCGVVITQNEPAAVPVATLIAHGDKSADTRSLITTDKLKSRERKASIIQKESSMDQGSCQSEILTSAAGPPCKKIRLESLCLTDTYADVGPPDGETTSSPMPNSDTANEDSSTSARAELHLANLISGDSHIQDPKVPTKVPVQHEDKMLGVVSRHSRSLSPLNCISIHKSPEPRVTFHPDDDDEYDEAKYGMASLSPLHCITMIDSPEPRATFHPDDDGDEANYGIVATKRDGGGQSSAESDYCLRPEGCESRPSEHQAFETAANRQVDNILMMPQPSTTSLQLVRRTQPASYFHAEILQRSCQFDGTSGPKNWQEQGVTRLTNHVETGFSQEFEQLSDTNGTQSNLLNYPAPDVDVGTIINSLVATKPAGEISLTSTNHNICSDPTFHRTEFTGKTSDIKPATQLQRNGAFAQPPEDGFWFSTTSGSPHSELSTATNPIVLDDNVMHQTSCHHEAPAKAVPVEGESKCTDSVRVTNCSSCGESCGKRAASIVVGASDYTLVSILVLIILLQTALLLMAGMYITASSIAQRVTGP